MDTNHFVLMCAAFLIVATWMVTMADWAERPAPVPAPVRAYACHFDGHCRALDCGVPLPDDIVLVPEDHEGAAYFYNPGHPKTHYRLQALEDNEFFGRIGQLGSMRLTLRETGALRVAEYAGITRDTEVLATATGMCQETEITPRGQD